MLPGKVDEPLHQGGNHQSLGDFLLLPRYHCPVGVSQGGIDGKNAPLRIPRIDKSNCS